ncbi:tRNA 4-thiouridine(8) synthase ThiI [Desulfuromonas versatilis]|uniref:tRNA 4-thiouridine(8) synthase ThiI n=1 Tax=Desulfuromonas versatilis TaxID=2802975 RepID=A0ABM8HXI9_9BACT|nr:thiamine biosynthesis protein [Desulfuromonas versatilis]BCR06685.1 tRNA 4-thiouridine(8) synthase ThiI [Desulfuromonas versatilis]
MSKALGLLSGGLDSSLAALTLKRQGVDVTCISFVTPFFGSKKAEKAAAQMDIPLIVSDIGDIHLEMVKNPRYGYGKNMNPCIDCHAMMFRLAGEIMASEGFDFLFSGEVLGQRPMSQNLTALKTVAKYSGHPERILRPLSARLLPITPMEEQGLVDREQLLDIQGRSRRRQEALAREWGLEEYPSSGGGCLLTEKSFSGRLRDLFEHQPEATVTDVQILKVGRQFRLSDHAKLALGRNQSDNEAIKNLARPGDTLLRAANFSGPAGLISGTPDAADLATAGAILASYGKGQNEPQVEILLQQGEREWTISVAPMDRDQVARLIVE